MTKTDARVRYTSTVVTDIKIGDVLVIQGALIREDGSHYFTVTDVKRTINGKRTRLQITLICKYMNKTVTYKYSANAKVCKGVEW